MTGRLPPLKETRAGSPPRPNEFVRLIARLDGFLGRKGDGKPGVKTRWLGLQPAREGLCRRAPLCQRGLWTLRCV